MCRRSVWGLPKAGFLMRSVRPVTSRRAQTAEGRQTTDTLRLLWQAIGRDIEVQRRVMQLLEDARREAAEAHAPAA